MLVTKKHIFVNFFGIMRYTLAAIFLLICAVLPAQTIITIEGQSYTNTEDTWYGVNIARSQPTSLIFRNNSITSLNRYGYLLAAGDEVPGTSNNNLDGAVISGNVLTWNGTPEIGIIPHGIFTGYNINVKVKYNYLNRVPMAIIRKSDGMTDVSGAVAYNIIKDPGIGVVVKGMNGVRIYNNTFYSGLTPEQSNRALIDIYENPSVTPSGTATGTKIFNNIFYTKSNLKNISIAGACLTGFESDYNVYYCESGTPMFAVDGALKTFTQWQALGYDIHSVVINPGFKDLVNFVPASRMDYGTDLGATWAEGLSVNARWGTTSPETAIQNGKWQVGAVIYKESSPVNPPPVNSPPLITIASPTKSTAFKAPATVTIDASTSDPDGSVIKVEFYNGTAKLGERTSAPWSFSWKDVTEGTYSITAAATDNSNSRSVSAAVTVIVEKAAPVVNKAPSVSISSPSVNSNFEAPATVTLTAAASDPDGSVTRVEYLVRGIKVGESFMPPFSFDLRCDTAGTFEITARAFDNLNATAISEPVRISLSFRREFPDLVNVYPAPNNGLFTVELASFPEGSDEVILDIISLTGMVLYTYILTTEEPAMQIDIAGATPGIYLVRITDRGKIMTAKRVVKY
jgi:hypothetical protein